MIRVRGMPVVEPPPKTDVDVVIVPEGNPFAGVWVRPNEELPRNVERRFSEMVVGVLRLRGHRASKFHFASEEKWAFVIGLCIVGQARREQLQLAATFQPCKV